MTGVELTRTVTCATCGGTKWSRQHPRSIKSVQCPDCVDGTVRVAVSCASCAHFSPPSDQYGSWCLQQDMPTGPDFGCKSWAAKEGTDGR